MRLGIILTGLAFLTAAEARADFGQANAAFADHRYAEAASGYEAVIRQHGYSAAVLFNAANAYYDDGQIGRAILNYERARLLAPEAADIRHNLGIARHRAGIAETPAPGTGTYALSGVCSLAAIMIAAGFLFRQVDGRVGLAWIAVNMLVLLATMFALALHFPERNRGIVVMRNATVYGAPATPARPLFTLAEGQTVVIRKTNGRLLLVEAGGHRGWVTSVAVEPVTPR